MIYKIVAKWVNFRHQTYPKLVHKIYVNVKKWYEGIIRKNTKLTYSNPYQTESIRSSNYEHYMQIALHHIREACENNWIRFKAVTESRRLADSLYWYIREISTANGHAPDILTKGDILRLLSLEVSMREEHLSDDEQSQQCKLSTLRMEIQSISEKELSDKQLNKIIKLRQHMNNVLGTDQLLTREL